MWEEGNNGGKVSQFMNYFELIKIFIYKGSYRIKRFDLYTHLDGGRATRGQRDNSGGHRRWSGHNWWRGGGGFCSKRRQRVVHRRSPRILAWSGRRRISGQAFAVQQRRAVKAQEPRRQLNEAGRCCRSTSSQLWNNLMSDFEGQLHNGTQIKNYMAES